MDIKTFFDNFETIANAPSGIASLREIILDLAISGQLLPQLLKESDSHQLTNELLDKREASLSNKSLAIRSAVDPEIGKVSFEIPSTWAWVTLSLFCHPQAGFAFKSSQFNSDGRGMPLIRIRDIGSEVTQCHYEGEFRTDFVVHRGDWLIGMDGNFNVRQWSGSDALLNQRVTRLIFLDERIEQRFIAWALQKHVSALMGTKSYTTVDHLSTKQINESLIPLPPLDEQRRIVTKVDELMALCDELEIAQQKRNSIRTAARKSAINAISTATTPDELDVAWKRISNNWSTIADTPESITSLRSLILGLAVRGKLVAQIGSEGVGSDFLYEFPDTFGMPQGKNSVPFEIPKTWTWSFFGNVSINRDSERIPISKPMRETRQGPYDYYGASGVIDSFDEFLFDKPLLLIGEDGANLVNRSTPIAFIARGKYWVNNHAHVIDSTSEEALEYLSIVINQMDLKPFLTGTAQPKLNQAKLNRLQIPVPPFEEQKRIVSKVAELMALCDELEESLLREVDLTRKLAGAMTVESAA